MARLNPVLTGLVPYPIQELYRIRDQIKAEGRPVHDFSVGDPVEPTPEFIRQAFLDAVGPISQYPPVAGGPEIRGAICHFFKRRYGVELDPDRQVLATSGSKEAIFHLPLAVIDKDAPDNLVVYPDPGYPAYERGALFSGGKPWPVPLSDDFLFRPWTLPEDVLRNTRLLYINSPHNPTGQVTGLDDLRRIYDVCRQYDILLVSDECYSELYDHEPPASMLQVGQEGVIVLNSLSKRSGMTGYRAGCLVGDPIWIQHLRLLRANPGLAPSETVNAAATVAWMDDAHVAERRARFSERRLFMLDFLRQAGIPVVDTPATLYIWFRAPAGFDDMSYALHLLKAGIVVTPGRMLAATDAGHGYLRLALVPDLEGCRQAVEAWKTLL